MCENLLLLSCWILESKIQLNQMSRGLSQNLAVSGDNDVLPVFSIDDNILKEVTSQGIVVNNKLNLRDQMSNACENVYYLF